MHPTHLYGTPCHLITRCNQRLEILLEGCGAEAIGCQCEEIRLFQSALPQYDQAEPISQGRGAEQNRAKNEIELHLIIFYSFHNVEYLWGSCRVGVMTDEENWQKTSADSPKRVCVNFKKRIRIWVGRRFVAGQKCRRRFLCSGRNTENLVNSMCVLIQKLVDFTLFLFLGFN